MNIFHYYKSESENEWLEPRLLFFAEKDKDDKEKDADTPESGDEKKKKGLTTLPPEPKDDADHDEWIAYEKELTEKKEEIKAEIKKRKKLGLVPTDLKNAQKSVDRGLKKAKETIQEEQINRESDEEVVLERASKKNDAQIANNRLNIRRLLKNYDILEGREKLRQHNEIYEGWEEGLYEMHLLDLDIGSLREGRQLYAGSNQTQKTADSIVATLEKNLENDRAEYEERKPNLGSLEKKKMEESFKQREQEIKDLKKKHEEEFYEAVDGYIDQLEEKRHKLKMNVVEKMITEFDKRLTRLIGLWQNPPEEYQYNKETTLTRLNNQKAVLDDIKDVLLIKDPVARHKQLKEKYDLDDFTDKDLEALRAFDIHLDNSELRSQEKGKQLIAKEEGYIVPEVEELEAEYEVLQKQAEEAAESVAFIESNRGDILTKFKEIEGMVKGTPLDDFPGEKDEQKKESYESTVGTIAESIQNLSASNLTGGSFRNEWGTINAEMEKTFKRIRDEKDPTSRKAMLQEMKDLIHGGKEYLKHITENKGSIEDAKKSLDNYANRHGQVSMLRATKDVVDIEFRFLNGSDLKRVFDKVFEFAERRWNRASDDRIGAVGSKLFDNIPNFLMGRIMKQLGNEFDKQREDAEQTEVDQYKSALSNKDAWQIQDVLETTTNVDEFKAAIGALSEIGRMRFDNPRFWKQLERFQSNVTILKTYSPENIQQLQQDSSELHDRLHKAMGYIWDFDTYYGFKNENDNNYENNKGAHFKRCDQIAETETGLGGRLATMLAQHKKAIKLNEPSYANPQEYEAIIEYSVKNGKMDPEDATYYLIQGIRHGILEWPDRINHFDSHHLNEYPVLELFSSAPGGTSSARKASWTEIEQWARIDSEKNGPGDDFKTWFWTYASHRARVMQRYDKTLTQGSNRMDHDYLTVAISFGDSGTIKNMLAKTAGTEFGAPVTGMMNGLVSYLKYMDNWALNRDAVVNSSHQASRVLSSFLVFDLITDGRMYKNKNYHRWTPTQLDDPNGPRYKHAYASLGDKRVGDTARDHIEKIRTHVRQIDPEFFDMIYNKTTMGSSDGVKQVVNYVNSTYPGVLEEPYPTSADALFDSIPKIVDGIVRGAKGKKVLDRFQEHVTTDIKNTQGDGAARTLDDIYKTHNIVQSDLTEIQEANKKAYDGKKEEDVEIMEFPDIQAQMPPSGLEGTSGTQLQA